ncbi:uncharacterized protein ACDP82_000586 [Pangshura tecta]
MAGFNLTPSEPSTFILKGIPGLEAAHIWISIPFVMLYFIGLLGNVMLLFVVGKEQTLHKPMYLLLCMLALTDIGTSTSVMPKALCIFWFNLKSITVGGCLTQMFFLHMVSAMQSAVLVTMAFDRYVAICNPLRYATILTNAQIAKLGLVGLTRAVLIMLPGPLLLSRQPFCGNHIIPHTYCEHMAVAKISCGDITFNRTYGLMVAFVVMGLDLTLIALSYGLIIRAILRISSKQAHQKALNTCTAHICVILISYTSNLFTILTHRFGQRIAPHVHIILANLYFLVPTMLNPIIYGVKNKEFRDIVGKYIWYHGHKNGTQDSGRSCTRANDRGTLSISEPDQRINHHMAAFNLTLFDPSVFILTGIPGSEAAHIWISIPFSMFYIISLFGNITVLFVIGKEQTLHKPMYLLLCMLALTDISMSTSVMPKALCIFWFNLKGITVGDCLTQMFFLHVVSGMKSAILVIMAFDHYIAICNPLRYTTILTNARIAKLGLVGLTRAVLCILPLPLLLHRQPFCAKRIIPHTYCEHIAVAKMSCGDITVNRMYGLVMAFVVIGLDVTLIALSYGLVIRAVLRISSKQVHQKAFNTCTAHICVILTSYASYLFSNLTHRFGQGITSNMHIILANLYFLIPPMLNPIIYGIKTKELRDKVSKYIFRI